MRVSLPLERFTEPLSGSHLPAQNLHELVSYRPFVWLQFLRHLGCIYCKGLVQDIRALLHSWNGTARPYLVFVHPNTVEEGEQFFNAYYPGVPHIANPSLSLYRFFRVRRASPWAELHPRNLFRLTSLLKRGLSNERPTADPWILHAAFLFREGTLVWSYYAKRLSDVPDWKRFL
jgi:hypothetical protein